MGQQKSKTSLKQIKDDVESIRRSVRLSEGTIEEDTKEELLKALKSYSQKVSYLNSHLSKKDVFKIQKLISDVSKEIYYEDIDVTPPIESPRLSFRSSKKKLLKIVEAIRNEVKTGGLTTKEVEKIHKTLLKVAKKLSRKWNSKNIDEALSYVATVRGELLLAHLDPGKQFQKTRINKATPLRDIEDRLICLENEAETAFAVADKKKLDYIAGMLKILIAKLQLIDFKVNINDREKKTELDQALVGVYRKIGRLKKQISREDNIAYLLEQQRREQTEENSAMMLTNRKLDRLFKLLAEVEFKSKDQKFLINLNEAVEQKIWFMDFVDQNKKDEFGKIKAISNEVFLCRLHSESPFCSKEAEKEIRNQLKWNKRKLLKLAFLGSEPMRIFAESVTREIDDLLLVLENKSE